VRARIPLSACLEVFASPTIVDDFYSSAINARTTAKKYVCILCMCVYAGDRNYSCRRFSLFFPCTWHIYSCSFIHWYII